MFTIAEIFLSEYRAVKLNIHIGEKYHSSLSRGSLGHRSKLLIAFFIGVPQYMATHLRPVIFLVGFNFIHLSKQEIRWNDPLHITRNLLSSCAFEQLRGSSSMRRRHRFSRNFFNPVTSRCKHKRVFFWDRDISALKEVVNPLYCAPCVQINDYNSFECVSVMSYGYVKPFLVEKKCPGHYL